MHLNALNSLSEIYNRLCNFRILELTKCVRAPCMSFFHFMLTNWLYCAPTMNWSNVVLMAVTLDSNSPTHVSATVLDFVFAIDFCDVFDCRTHFQ